jgi:predicted nuclease with TOPRIM domain
MSTVQELVLLREERDALANLCAVRERQLSELHRQVAMYEESERSWDQAVSRQEDRYDALVGKLEVMAEHVKAGRVEGEQSALDVIRGRLYSSEVEP